MLLMTNAADILNWITQPHSESGLSEGLEGLGLIEVRCFIQRGDTGVFTPIGGYLPNSQLDQIKADLWSWYDSLGWSLTKYENEGNINDWWKVNLQESVSEHIVFELHGEHSEFGTKELANLTLRKVSDTSAGIIEGLEASYKPPTGAASRTGGPPPSTYTGYYPPPKTHPAGSMAALRK